jgi:glutathione synthase/RimK-type ligase-like ATP-grasp enzyme
MSSDKPVLIISTIADAATDEVVRELNERQVPCVRINTENFPFSGALLNRPASHAEFDQRCISTPCSIWYRRLRTPSKPENMDAGVYDFCLQESRAALLGQILSLNTRWMSHPRAIWQAENKPLQLSTAAAIGLCIPGTVITNDPSEIRAAFAEFGEMIVKPVRSGYFTNEGAEHSVFTSRVLQEHLENLESAVRCPSIYQKLIPKRFDIRITVVGQQIFAAAIDSQSDASASVDWRHTSNPNLPHYPVTLPQDLQAQLLTLMKHFDLSFAAIDMIETPSGEYVFLEINPSGQWLWLDDLLNFGISSAVADWLAFSGYS